MTAKELRLGNLISVLGNVVEVIKIYGERKIEVHSDILQFWDVDIEEEDDDVKPIPLTEEWLSIFKFHQKYTSDPQQQNPSEAWFIKDFTIHSVYGSLKFFFYSYEGLLVEIKTVHQLQNLYYSVSLEELEVKS